MHAPTTLLPVFFSILSASALPSSSSSTTSPSHKCTFTLLQKQIRTTNYIQINHLFDHTNDIAINVASLRPNAAHNSYAKVSANQVFAIEGLLDNGNLTVWGMDGIAFQSAGLIWTSERRVSKAGCDVGTWGESGKNKVSSYLFLNGGWVWC
jgi:hypothetical protein